MTVAERDILRLADLLEKPPQPNEKLLAAARIAVEESLPYGRDSVALGCAD